MSQTISEAIRQIKRNNIFPLHVSVTFKSYQYFGSNIPGGLFIEIIENKKQQDVLVQYINDCRYVLDENKQRFEVVDTIIVSV